MHVTITDLPDIITKYSNVTPNNIFEIGASNGADANHLKEVFGVKPINVYCFEPNPSNFNALSNNFPNYNNYNVAVSDYVGKTAFQLHGPAADISSIKQRVSHYIYQGNRVDNYSQIDIDVIRMDHYMNTNNIEGIDICKIDVEGCSYEVISGFGDRLADVKILHVEGELIELYENQKLYSDFANLLTNFNFTLVDYKEFDGSTQCDSVWVNNQYLK